MVGLGLPTKQGPGTAAARKVLGSVGPRGRGGYMTCGWTGVCRPVFRKLLLITDSFRHTHFYDEFSRKTTHFLQFFCQFLECPPMFKENLPKKEPCLENFRPKTHPYGRHIPTPSTCYVTLPPREWARCLTLVRRLYRRDSGLTMGNDAQCLLLRN